MVVFLLSEQLITQINMEADNNNKELVEGTGVQTIDHLLIRDKDSGKVLVKVRNTARNLPPEDSDGSKQD